MSKNEYDGERLALESQVAHGLTTRAEADKWITAMVEQPNGRYVHQDEILGRLAGEERNN